MESINLSERIDKYFALPKSNRGFKPSVFIETLILMQHEGSFHLDDVRHIHDDEALRAVLGLDKIPQAGSLGNWLRDNWGQRQCRLLKDFEAIFLLITLA